MDLASLTALLRRSWRVVLVAALLGIVTAGALHLTRTPRFEATSEVYVTVPGTTTTSELAQGGSAAQQKIQSFVAITRSATVLAPVVRQLQLGGTPADLAQRVDAASPFGSVLIDITVTDTDPERAAATADAIAASLAEVVQGDLERREGGASSFRLQTVEPAAVPRAPVGPSLTAVLLGGGLLGAALGLGAAQLRALLDRRIHDRETAEALLSTPVLGSITFDPDSPTHPLVVQQEGRSLRAEDVRRLRTNLQFLGQDPATYVMTSAVQGEGKTTTVANLAVALASLGLRVALVDADLRRPAIADVMGIEGAYGLTDLLIGRGELDSALQPWGTGGLRVLPSGPVPPNPTELLASPAMELVLAELRTQFDVVLVDAPPLLPVSDALVLGARTDGVLMALALHQTSKHHAAAARTVLTDSGTCVRGLVLTKVRQAARDAYVEDYALQASATSRAGRDR